MAAEQIAVYYINLGSRPDRRAFMEEQFVRLGIAAERLEAVRGDEVGDDRMAPHRDADNPWAMSRIEAACSLSHEAAWRRMLEGGQPFALVLEDDVVLGGGVRPLLQPNLVAALGADLIKLETFFEPIRVGRVALRVGERFAVRQLLASHLGAGAYIISADMARRTLADPAWYRMSVDRYLFTRNGPVVPSRAVFQVDPAPAVQLGELRDGEPNAAARSDLSRERLGMAARPRSFRAGLREFSASFSYTLRLVGHVLADPEARRHKRRRIAFDPDP